MIEIWFEKARQSLRAKNNPFRWMQIFPPGVWINIAVMAFIAAAGHSLVRFSFSFMSFDTRSPLLLVGIRTGTHVLVQFRIRCFGTAQVRQCGHGFDG